MVAKITIPKSIEAALNYNEKKVQKNKAVCLYAANYLNEAKNMNFYQKLNGFKRLNVLNDRATTKTLHVSLNFDPSEKLSDEKLMEIGLLYMDKIGFAAQPFLIYKHQDAGHPHIHIVSTAIRDDGSRINTHNIGRNQSEKARKEIEQKYGLIKADRQQKLLQQKIRPVNIEKALYGKHETKQIISNIVSAVFTQYKFASLPEFNAALKQFNVVADRGKEEGRIYKNRGLIYRILDAGGNKIGMPIKASSISFKPTLNNLEIKFLENGVGKDAFKQATKNKLDDCFGKSRGTMSDLIAALYQKNIYTVLRQNSEGRLYGITFVDNQNKCVFNGSDLGKGYSAAAIQSRLSATPEIILTQDKESGDHSSGQVEKDTPLQKQQEKKLNIDVKNESLIDLLLSAKEQFGNTPFQLLKKKKKKRKKNTGS